MAIQATIAAAGKVAAAEAPASIHVGIDWLDAARKEAWTVYQNLPLPERGAHLWRYTDPKAFELQPAASISAGNGFIHTDQVSRDDGVRILPLLEAASTLGELVRGRLGRVVPAEFGKPEALNAAVWHGGFLIHVPRGVRLEDPIRIVTALDHAESFRAARNLVLIDEGASATVVEESNGGPEGGRADLNEVTEAWVAPGGRLNLVLHQHLSRGVTSHRTVRSLLSRDAIMETVIASFGGALYKSDIGSLLAGKGAESRMAGFCFADGRQRADHHTVHDHREEHTTSDINFRVVLSGRARSAYTGLIRIAKDAPYCEAFQENRNLLLSDKSRAESIPELEILTDEVRCTHGATAGPIDPEQIFYLTSRGLTERDATRIVVGGFLEETLERIPEVMRDPIREEFSRRLEEGRG